MRVPQLRRLPKIQGKLVLAALSALIFATLCLQSPQILAAPPSAAWLQDRDLGPLISKYGLTDEQLLLIYKSITDSAEIDTHLTGSPESRFTGIEMFRKDFTIVEPRTGALLGDHDQIVALFRRLDANGSLGRLARVDATRAAEAARYGRDLGIAMPEATELAVDINDRFSESVSATEFGEEAPNQTELLNKSEGQRAALQNEAIQTNIARAKTPFPKQNGPKSALRPIFNIQGSNPAAHTRVLTPSAPAAPAVPSATEIKWVEKSGVGRLVESPVEKPGLVRQAKDSLRARMGKPPATQALQFDYKISPKLREGVHYQIMKTPAGEVVQFKEPVETLIEKGLLEVVERASGTTLPASKAAKLFAKLAPAAKMVRTVFRFVGKAAGPLSVVLQVADLYGWCKEAEASGRQCNDGVIDGMVSTVSFGTMTYTGTAQTVYQGLRTGEFPEGSWVQRQQQMIADQRRKDTEQVRIRQYNLCVTTYRSYYSDIQARCAAQAGLPASGAR